MGVADSSHAHDADRVGDEVADSTGGSAPVVGPLDVHGSEHGADEASVEDPVSAEHPILDAPREFTASSDLDDSVQLPCPSVPETGGAEQADLTSHVPAPPIASPAELSPIAADEDPYGSADAVEPEGSYQSSGILEDTAGQELEPPNEPINDGTEGV